MKRLCAGPARVRHGRLQQPLLLSPGSLDLVNSWDPVPFPNPAQVALRQALPDLDVVKLAETAPSLLWTENVAACATQTVDLIRNWSPRSDALVVVETYPELIVRIPKYYADREFHELPVRSKR